MSKKTTAADENAAVEVDNSLSRKRRMALITYLAILFVVALAIVTLSLVIQIKNNTQQFNTISEKAHALQLDNEQLQKENAKQQNDAVRQQAELDKLQSQLDTLQSQLDEQKEQIATLQESNDALSEQCEHTVQAYELLAKAKEARAEGDEEALAMAMDALEPIYQTLSIQAQAEYDAILDEMNPDTETTEKP